MRRLFSLGSIAAAYTKFESSAKVDAEVSARVHTEVNATPADPEVVEFFKYFPEPYKQHAIERYSQRDGLYKWKLFRNMDMEKEKQSALSGVFLEDIRKAEQLAKEELKAAREKARAERQAAYEEQKKGFYEREVPQWEQWLLKYVPLQPGETMPFKLLQVSLLSLSGVSAVVHAVFTLGDRTFPRWRARALLVVGTGLCICVQILAFARLMDLGPFDRSVDDRDVATKFAEYSDEKYGWIADLLNTRSTWR